MCSTTYTSTAGCSLRRALRGALARVGGETAIDPRPPKRGTTATRRQLDAEGLEPAGPYRRPDAVLEIAGDRRRWQPRSSSSTTAPRRSTRTTASFAATTPSSPGGGGTRPYADQGAPPWVLFVCQDENHRDKFLAAADPRPHGPALAPISHPHREPLPRAPADPVRLRSRRVTRTYSEARRLPGFPPRDPSRRGAAAEAGRVRLPGPGQGGIPGAGRTDVPT